MAGYEAEPDRVWDEYEWELFFQKKDHKQRSTWSCWKSTSIIRNETKSSRARWVGPSFSTKKKAIHGVRKSTRCWRKNRVAAKTPLNRREWLSRRASRTTPFTGPRSP